MFMRFLYFFVSDKATNPSNRQEDWEYIMSFCDQINKELEGYGHVHLITPASPCTHNQIVCPLLVVNTQAFVFLTLLSLHCIVWIAFLAYFQSTDICQTVGIQDSITTGMGSNASINGVWWIYFTVFFILILVKILVCFLVFFLKNIFWACFCFCRFLKLVWRIVGEGFTTKLGNLSFWMN